MNREDGKTSDNGDELYSNSSAESENNSEDILPAETEKSTISNFLPVFRVKMTLHSIPIIISITISGLLAWYIHNVVEFETVIPENSPSQGLINGLIYTAFAIVSSIVIYLLVKRKGQNVLKIIMTIAFMFLSFTLFLFFGMLLVPFLESSYIVYYTFMGISAILAVLLTYLYFSGKLSKWPKNIYVLGIGTLIGGFMGIAMPPWTTAVLLIGVSVWDIISVRRGPIKGIMEIMNQVDHEAVSNMTEDDFKGAEIQIGIGDIAFYSMLTSGCLILTSKYLIFTGSIIVTLFAAIGILIGAFVTIRALRKNAILPGLPFSIFLGMTLAFFSYYIIVVVFAFQFVL
ncbi:MAG: hypothetical protein JW776_06555 [Candidatus Lokiarchaeota archaeon]|nr:hypothetical protein [Candidatus Lokiarchaeota archaeon]